MLKNIYFLFVTIILFCSNAYCQTKVLKIRPSQTDSLIVTFNADSHYVYFNAEAIPANTLVVHLPGSFGEPKRATIFGKHAAELGFHSIGLMYPNAPTVGSLCTNSSDTTCFEHVRREIIEGVDYSSRINILPNESILNRLKKLLVYLHNNYPTENWQQYLDSENQLIFSKIIFSGHSQGGGHAAMIGKYYPIKRAVCFSSPKDWSNFSDSPPAWLSSGNWQINPDQIYCFNHILDEHPRQLLIWESMGLDVNGPPVDVDINNPPFNTSRQLTTAYDLPNGDEHGSTVQDNKTPIISGVPVFQPVWTYMLTNKTSTNISDDVSAEHKKHLIYPNPSRNSVYFNVSEELMTIRVTDQTGKILYTSLSCEGLNSIDLSDFSPGLYFILIETGDKVYSGKIIKI